VVSTSPTYTFTLDRNRYLVAEFIRRRARHPREADKNLGFVDAQDRDSDDQFSF
jgi:hypothetical protein